MTDKKLSVIEGMGERKVNTGMNLYPDNPKILESSLISYGYNIAVKDSYLVCPEMFVCKVLKVDFIKKILFFGVTHILHRDEKVVLDLLDYATNQSSVPNFNVYSYEFLTGNSFGVPFKKCVEVLKLRPSFAYDFKNPDNLPEDIQINLSPKEMAKTDPKMVQAIKLEEILDLYPEGSEVIVVGDCRGKVIKIFKNHANKNKVGWAIQVTESFSGEEILPDFPLIKFIPRSSIIRGKIKLSKA